MALDGDHGSDIALMGGPDHFTQMAKQIRNRKAIRTQVLWHENSS